VGIIDLQQPGETMKKSILPHPLLEKRKNTPTLRKDPCDEAGSSSPGSIVGAKIREIRSTRRLSLRSLAQRSGLNINTLSLVENGKSSPSVSTLQQLAFGLDVPITAFFASEPDQKRVVFTPAGDRPHAAVGPTCMENLGKDLAGNSVQPFVVTLDIGGTSGSEMIVHTGYEFVYCLSGKVLYIIDGVRFELNPHDSIVFESHIPHRWENLDSGPSGMVLVYVPDDQRDNPGEHHFPMTQTSLGAGSKPSDLWSDQRSDHRSDQSSHR
jgi:DNA-binding XRE family transcriptional regulator/uncharacterized cupin superfamily protein